MIRKKRSTSYSSYSVGHIVMDIFELATNPIVGIWALNQLFSLTIQYSLINWFACFILFGLIRPSGNRQ